MEILTKIGALIFGVMFMAYGLIGTYQGFRSVSNDDNLERLEGIVIDYKTKIIGRGGASEKLLYAPIIEYLDQNGKVDHYTTEKYLRKNDFKIGQNVKLLVNDNTVIGIDSRKYLFKYPIAGLILGLLLIYIAFTFKKST